MNIIEKILTHKQEEIRSLDNYLNKNLEKNTRSFLKALTRKKENPINIIAEIKQASPSAGQIKTLNPVTRANVYESSGAAAISCLTDQKFFQGSCQNLQSIVSNTSIPVIRKDFIFTKNQIAESRFFGASSYLLMVEVMEKMETDLSELIAYGQSLGMEPLVETYSENSIKKALEAGAKIIGVNSRNFQKEGLPIEFDRFEKLLPLIPDGVIKVAESGISKKSDIEKINHLADATLVGTALMKKTDPEVTEFISSLKDL